MRAQDLPRRSQVPRPISGMRAPLASTDGDSMAGTSQIPAASRAATMPHQPDRANPLRRFPPQHRERHVRRLVEQLEQRPRRTARMALALLPVAHRLDRHADAGGELGLRQAGLRADAAGVAGIDLRRPSGLNGRRQDAPIGLGGTGGIARSLPSARISTRRPSAFSRTRIIAASCRSGAEAVD